MRRIAAVAAFLCIALMPLGCENPKVSSILPGWFPVRLLSTASPTKDEDPSVIRARDGSLFVVWFSDRRGNPDIYISRTVDDDNWTFPVRVTTSVHGDFYPNLIQDDQGTFHLVWFRWEALNRGHIWYNSSADGVTWNPANEVQVTQDAGVDDWVPSLVRMADGALLVYFVSEKRDAAGRTKDLYVAVRPGASTTWQPAVPLTALNNPTEHEHLPSAAWTGSEVTLVFVRHDTTNALPWMQPTPKSDLWYATSPDGLTWGAPTRITNEAGPIVNLFPALYADQAGVWTLIWLSTRLGSPKVFETPVSALGTYPVGVVENQHLPDGYSHRIAPTRTARYVGVWVRGPEGAQDIYYRYFFR